MGTEQRTEQRTTLTELRVSGKTPSKSLADSVTSYIRDGVENIALVAIGHNALGQAIKAVPIVNGHLAPRGIMFSILPMFDEREIEDDDGVKVLRTAVILKLVRVTF